MSDDVAPCHAACHACHPMKIFIRLFFKTLRLVLGPFMLLWEVLSRPKAITRAPAQQREVDALSRNLTLYQFSTCPFCIKVRKEIHRLALPIERRDAQHAVGHRAELLQGSGAVQVPCLRITHPDGKVQWLAESGAIISYLNQRFAG